MAFNLESLLKSEDIMFVFLKPLLEKQTIDNKRDETFFTALETFIKSNYPIIEIINIPEETLSMAVVGNLLFNMDAETCGELVVKNAIFSTVIRKVIYDKSFLTDVKAGLENTGITFSETGEIKKNTLSSDDRINLMVCLFQDFSKLATENPESFKPIQTKIIDALGGKLPHKDFSILATLTVMTIWKFGIDVDEAIKIAENNSIVNYIFEKYVSHILDPNSTDEVTI